MIVQKAEKIFNQSHGNTETLSVMSPHSIRQDGNKEEIRPPTYRETVAAPISTYTSFQISDEYYRQRLHNGYRVPGGRYTAGQSTIITQDPGLSTSIEELCDFINIQVKYAPHYFVKIKGSHIEHRSNGSERRSRRVVDFDFLVPFECLDGPVIKTKDDPNFKPYTHGINLPFHDTKAYRGGVFRSTVPHMHFDDQEATIGLSKMDAIESWCLAFINTKASCKSFTIQHHVINHNDQNDTKIIENQIRQTGYLGDVDVKFILRPKKVVIYSPGKINTYRNLIWLRWFFYLTFLWIFAWPILFLCTKKWNVVDIGHQFNDTTQAGSCRSKFIGAAIRAATNGKIRGQDLTDEFIEQSIINEREMLERQAQARVEVERYRA